MNEKELVGVTLGNCTVERMIGKGGMAIVFLAQQARPTRTVALKVLLPSIGENDPDKQQIFLERFRREADTIAKLEHKNILPVYEYQEAAIKGQHLAYLVMPYVRGGTLRQRIEGMRHNAQQFDLQTVSSYISQIADALSYAHNLGVIHRDIKPGNLLFHSDGRLLLSDFGIARLSALPALTLIGSFIGTAEYASPEQINAGELDARSDIYALGVILYELLTGEVPFTGPTPFAVMTKQLRDPVPSVRTKRPDLSPAVEFVVKKALAKAPKDRYQHASELAADLHAAITPALAQPVGLRLSGDADSHSDLTIAEGAWQPPAAHIGGPTTPMPQTSSAAALQDAPQVSIPPTQRAYPIAQPFSQPPASQLPPQPGDAAWQNKPAQLHLPPVTLDVEESNQIKTYRTGRRLYLLSIGVTTLALQFLVLGLTIGKSFHSGEGEVSISLGVLLGNALNLLTLAAIAFTSVTRQWNLRKIFNRVFLMMLLALGLSGLFISFGQFSPLHVPVLSYIVLLFSNLYSLRQLRNADAARDRLEIAPVAWRAAIVGALTGLIPLIIILIFALIALPWTSGSVLFLHLLAVLAIGFIGAPTPGAMMAVWLSHKMSFPILVRTSAVAGLFMFVAAYIVVFGLSWLITGQTLFGGSGNFMQQQQVLPLVVIGACLGLVGFLRGMLDAWVYHRVMMRMKLNS